MTETGWAALVILVSGVWIAVTIWAVRTFGTYSARHVERMERVRDDIKLSRDAIMYAEESNRIAGERLTVMLREVQRHQDDGTCYREDKSA